MNYKYGFEKLQVWQDARQLVKIIYKLTAKYPSSEKFGLTNQMRRCAVSISSNLAEGTGRNSSKDQAHFLFHGVLKLSGIDESNYFIIGFRIYK